jgi:hypothetical protein
MVMQIAYTSTSSCLGLSGIPQFIIYCRFLDTSDESLDIIQLILAIALIMRMVQITTQQIIPVVKY